MHGTGYWYMELMRVCHRNCWKVYMPYFSKRLQSEVPYLIMILVAKII
jgi:hypothetical protein